MKATFNKNDNHYEVIKFDVEVELETWTYYFGCTRRIIWYDQENDIEFLKSESDKPTEKELDYMLDTITEKYL